jgi:hypothetical protein
VTFGTRTRSNLSKVGFLEGARDFDRAVAAEVVENDRIAVLDGTDRLAVLGDDERRQILVDGSRELDAQRLDRFRGAGELVALTEDVRVPAAIDHAPVGVVTVHGDVHAPAAGGDLRVEAAGAELGEEGFERLDVVERAGFRHVAAVEQRMHANRLDALFLGANDHRLQVIDVAMHVAVGEEADEMDDAATGLGTGDDLLPGFALPDGAGGDGVGDQRCALAVDLTGADGVVADFGIAHILVGRHADGRTVGAQGMFG